MLQTAGVEGEVNRPLRLFLHIPKTAGTSFLLQLRNVFGDRHIHRFNTVDESTQRQLADLIDYGSEELTCFAGHWPFQFVEPYLERATVFTILRHPVARVASLFRFLQSSTSAELARLDLQPGFTFQDFLHTANPELFAQLHDGMVRILSGEAQLLNPDYRAFWSEPLATTSTERALSNLARIEYGIAEEMESTLDLLRARWGIPFSLPSYRENASSPQSSPLDDDALGQIAARNQADIALYEEGLRGFRKLLDAGVVCGSFASGYDPRAVFAAPLDRNVSVRDMPGRTGFHEFENTGFAWLQADVPSTIHFVAAAGRRRLQFRLRCLFEGYPIERTSITINDRQVSFSLTRVDSNWFLVTTEPFEVETGLNRAEVASPLFVPVSEANAGSADTRRLGLAASHVGLRSEGE